MDEEREKERKIVVCTDDDDGAPMVVSVVLVVVVVVVEANEQVSRRTGRLDNASETGGWGDKGGWQGGKGEDREGTKGKRVQAGLGSDEGECVTVCIVDSLFSTGEGLPSICPALLLPLPSL